MIGIFDSGSGGLTVLKAVREKIPTADIVYFGDIKNAPYGEKSPETLLSLTIGAIDLLQKEGAGSIVSACNSVSASMAIASDRAASILPGHLIEMVGPTVASFENTSETVLLVATPATIASEMYQRGFATIGKDIRTLAIPDLAAAIEFGAPAEKIEEIIREAFDTVQLNDFDTLILACTHYPLVLDSFRRILGEKVILFDPAQGVANRVYERLGTSEQGAGTMRFLISKDSPLFRNRVAELIGSSDQTIEVLE